ncbi:MAG: cytosine permease [Microbacteriaceae bacterium]
MSTTDDAPDTSEGAGESLDATFVPPAVRRSTYKAPVSTTATPSMPEDVPSLGDLNDGRDDDVHSVVEPPVSFEPPVFVGDNDDDDGASAYEIPSILPDERIPLADDAQLPPPLQPEPETAEPEMVYAEAEVEPEAEPEPEPEPEYDEVSPRPAFVMPAAATPTVGLLDDVLPAVFPYTEEPPPAELWTIDAASDDYSDDSLLENDPSPVNVDISMTLEEQAAALANLSAPVGRPWTPERRSLPDSELMNVLDAASGTGGTLEKMQELETQMLLRSEEAREFGEWEQSMLAIGTPEALEAVRKVRPAFAGLVSAVPALEQAPESPTGYSQTFAEPPPEPFLQTPSAMPPPASAPMFGGPPPLGETSIIAPPPLGTSVPMPPPGDEPVLFDSPPPPPTSEPFAAPPPVEDTLGAAGPPPLVEPPVAADLPEPWLIPSSTLEHLGNERVNTEGAVNPASPELPVPVGDSGSVSQQSVGADPDFSLQAGTSADAGEADASLNPPPESELSQKPTAAPTFRIERSGVMPTPIDQRVGRAARMFWLWFAANSSIVSIGFGATLFSLGMSLRQAIVSALVGVALSCLPLGLGALAGKRSGQPTVIVSRAVFGVVGNIVPAMLALVTRVFWGGVLLWLASTSTAFILIGAELGGGLSYDQLVIVGLAIGFMLAVIVAFFGYSLLARFQFVVSILAAILVVGLIVMTWPLVDIREALTVDDGNWVLAVTGAVLVFSFIGLVWANSSSDLARYQRPGASGAGSMLWASFGTTVPTFLLIAYGAVLAASNADLALGLVERPLDVLAGLLPMWYPVPLIAVTGLSLLSGIVISLYSAGFALQGVGAQLSRQWTTLIAGVMLFFVAWVLSILDIDLSMLFRDIATTLAVPVAAWVGIFAADTMIRKRRYHTPSLVAVGGVYPAIQWVNLSAFVAISAIGFAFTTATVSWLTWQGYGFSLVGLPLDGEVAASDFGVVIALLLGILTPVVAGVPAIRKQEATIFSAN